MCGRVRARTFALMLSLLTSITALTAPHALAAPDRIRVGTASSIEGGAVASSNLRRKMSYRVYLPENYHTTNTTFRVLYLLHGAGGNERTWLRLGHIQRTADQLISAKAIPPVVIVMPGCSRCWWVDGARERAETAVWQDLIPHIEQRYRVRADRGGRFFAGLSAGGHAVLRYALKYPDRMAAAAALSPAIYLRSPPSFSAARRTPSFLSTDGQFDHAAWYRRNYPDYVTGYAAQKQRVNLYLVAGRQDRFGTANEMVRFYYAMRRHQRNAITIRLADGSHNWRFWSGHIGRAMVAILNTANATRTRITSR